MLSHKISTITNRKKKEKETKTNKEQNVTFSETLNDDDILEKINYSIILGELPPTTCSWSFQRNRNFSRKQYVGHFCGCFRLLCAGPYCPLVFGHHACQLVHELSHSTHLSTLGHSAPPWAVHTVPRHIVHTGPRNEVHTIPRYTIHTGPRHLVHTGPRNVVYNGIRHVVHTGPRNVV